MTVIGLTGGIGMGKSAVAAMFEGLGASVVDTDRLAREVVEPGRPAWVALRHWLGDEFFDVSGELRRSLLARKVFADADSRAKLESIVHPPVREAWSDRLACWREAGVAVAVVVIPLLFETRAEPAFAATVCVACLRETQKERLLARGWSEEEIEQRIRSQWPTEKKLTAAHYAIWTEGPLELVRRQVHYLWQGMSPQISAAGERGVP